MALTKVTGDFIKAGSITQGHLHSSHGITTTHIAEGDKLFFTNARVDSRVGSLSTSNLSEGTNLYYTNARADARIALQVGSNLDLSSKSTSDLSEGTNLYYTQARFNTAFTAKSTSDLSEGTNLYYTNARADARIAAASTSDLSEGTNLYYTDARADARITAADTDSLSEGSTNLYYTDARADARVALIVDSAPGTLNTLNELAAALGDDANFSTTVTNSIATKLPLAGGTLTGQVIFPSAATTRPVLPNGFISRDDLTDTSGRHDIWGISEKYYPSNATTGDAWGIQWSGTPNDVVFVGAGTDRFTVSLDEGNVTAAGIITATGGNSTQWNTAYGWGDHAGGGYAADSAVMKLTGNQTISGTKTFDNGSIVISGTHGTISFMDTTSGEDNFYLHTNSNNFYVLADRDATDAIDGGYDSPHPLQLEGDTNTAYVFGSALNISNWNTAYGWGDHGAAGYLTSFDITTQTDGKYIRSDANDTASGIITLTKNTATGLANSTFSHAKTIIGGIHFANGNGPAANNGNQAAITFQGGSASEAQAGIYVHNNNSEGTHMMFATTNSYATGPQAGITLLNNGNVTIRGTVGASNFSGSSSGTNTGDQDLSGYATSATTLAGYGITNAIQKGAQIASGASWNTATRFGSTGDLSQAAGNHALSVRSENNNDAFMSFHIGSDYAVHFGLDGATNRMHVGGWSDGTGTQYQLYDSRDFSVASVLNSNVTLATLGYSGATNANYITNNNQLTNGAAYITASGTSADSNLLDGTDWGSAASRRKLGLSARTTEDRNTHSTNARYHTGVMGWGTVDFNTLLGRGSGFFDTWSNPGNQPSTETSHWNGHQVLHYTDGSNYHHGYQMAVGAGNPAYCYIRGWWANGGTGTAWAKMYNSANLTLAVLGYTGATNANYITNNNQLTNGAGYTTNTGTLTNSNDRFYLTDTRGASRAPSYYDDRYIQGDFSQSAYFGVSGGDAWAGILTVSKWSSWDASHRQEQLIFAGTKLARRVATSDTAWSSTYDIIDTSGVNNVKAGYIQSSASLRAPILYDSDDTNAYFSANRIVMRGVDPTIIMRDTDQNSAMMHVNSSRWYLLRGSNDTSSWSTTNGHWPLYIELNTNDAYFGRHLYSLSSMRSPIFYDRDNTGYYVDPASTSNLNAATFAGDITVNGNQVFTLGGNADVKFAVWDSTIYGIGMTSGVTLGNLNDYAMTFCMNNDADRGFWWGYAGQSKGAGAMSLTTNGKLYVTTHVIAPIYYDTNTAYYVDAASTANLNAVTLNYINYKNSNFRVGDSTTMNAITSGGQNVAFGPEALGACNTGTRNFAYGYAALASLTSGANNIAMGDATGYNVSTGSNNLLFGVSAGRTGYQSPQSIAGVTSHNHQIHMGNESHTTARIQISWTVNSDARDKTDITPIDIGLDFVKQLNPVTYRWDKRSDYEDRTPDGTNKLPELTLGFLAQEVEVVEKSFGYDVANQTNLVVDRIPEQDHYGITYEKMVPILTKAIQEQQTIIDDLKSRLETLENQ